MVVADGAVFVEEKSEELCGARQCFDGGVVDGGAVEEGAAGTGLELGGGDDADEVREVALGG